MKQEKILIVENESIIAKDLEMSLQRLGWSVCGTAYSGKDALEKVRKLQPGLILMDIKLGKGIDGIETAQHIAAFADIPIIYLTGFTDDETLDRAKITNPCGYVIKPIEDRNLEVTIEMGLHNYRVEKQLQEKEKWLGMIVENLNEGLVVIDRGGVIRLLNPAAEFYTGWKKDAAVGLPYHDVLQTFDRYTGAEIPLPFSAAMNEAVEMELEDDLQLRGREDSVITIDGKCVPVLDDKGNITGSMLVFHDITLRKKLESQLRQSQKMEAIGALAGGIAHDFNNILSAIVGNTQLTMKKLPEPNGVQRYLDQVLTAAGRARGLVKQILTFSRQGKEKRMPVQVGLMVREVLQLVRSSSPGNISIRQDIKAPGGLVMGDPTQVHQILMNLCTNAVHAMKEKGGILTVGLEEGETCLCLSVRDTGSGMDSQTLARIFEPYFTTKDPEEGTGMGLAVVHGIVKSHGGTIDVESTPGKGTTFHVILPKLSARTQKKPLVQSLLPRGQEKILFVDDEQPMIDIVRDMLGQYGYTVVGRTDSLHALEEFHQDPGQFDLVIVDAVMPGLTGPQLAEKLLEVRPEMPIIMCTGFSDTSAAEKAMEVGIKEVVMKPIITDQLSTLIRGLLDNKEMRQ